MATRVQFLVSAELNRETGKFATRDELVQACQEAIEQADPGSVEGSEGGTYNVDSWEVEEYVPPKLPRAKKGKVEASGDETEQG